MSSKYSKELIKKIRREVLSGKTKYGVAKELNVCDKMVYYYTKDIFLLKVRVELRLEEEH
jgi:hypothetical protein